MDFIGKFYCFFEGFFGEKLGEYLWGYDPVAGDYTNSCLFPQVALWTLLFSLLIAVLYYYVLDHPNFSRWWHWLIMLVVNAVINLFYGFWYVYDDFQAGLIPESLINEMDEDGNILTYYITDGSLWGFGFANALISIILFFVVSVCIKWGAKSTKYSPF